MFAVSRSINSSLSELLILVFHHNSLVLVLCNEDFFFKKEIDQIDFWYVRMNILFYSHIC